MFVSCAFYWLLFFSPDKVLQGIFQFLAGCVIIIMARDCSRDLDFELASLQCETRALERVNDMRTAKTEEDFASILKDIEALNKRREEIIKEWNK